MAISARNLLTWEYLDGQGCVCTCTAPVFTCATDPSIASGGVGFVGNATYYVPLRPPTGCANRLQIRDSVGNACCEVDVVIPVLHYCFRICHFNFGSGAGCPANCNAYCLRCFCAWWTDNRCCRMCMADMPITFCWCIPNQVRCKIGTLSANMAAISGCSGGASSGNKTACTSFPIYIYFNGHQCTRYAAWTAGNVQCQCYTCMLPLCNNPYNWY